MQTAYNSSIALTGRIFMILRPPPRMGLDGAVIFSLCLSCIIFLSGSIAIADDGATQAPGFNRLDQDVVLRLLKGYEWTLRESEFLELGPEVSDRLLEIAQDTDQPNFIHARAASALTLFPTQDVATYYVRELGAIVKNDYRANTGVRSPGEVVRRRQIVQNYCHTFAESEPQRVESVVLPLLEEPDAHLRAQSARCLATIDSDNSRKALARYRESIEETWERNAAGFGERERQ